jgi:hypothetical protein
VARLWRLALTLWFVSTLLFEFLGPFNLLHEHFRVQVWELLFWALSCTVEAAVIVALIPGGRLVIMDTNAAIHDSAHGLAAPS